MEYQQVIHARRSQYNLSRQIPISETELESLIDEAINTSPTAFNSRSSRIIVVYGDEHEYVWSRVLAGIKREIGEGPAFDRSTAKINQLKDSYGTILFYEETAITEDLMVRFPLYAHNFYKWADHSQGMLQFNVWTTLANNGIGANLQHYSELIAADLNKHFNLSTTWKLVAQMPFGVSLKQPDPVSPYEGDARLIVKK